VSRKAEPTLPPFPVLRYAILRMATMARLCEPCRFHTADDSVSACGECGGPVKFTLLPPPGETAQPMANLPGAPEVEATRPKPLGLLDFFQGKLLFATLAVIALCVAGGAFLYLNKGESFEARVAKCKPGMRMIEAMQLFGDENYVIDDPDEDDGTLRTPIDVMGSGYVVYQEFASAVKISYAVGKVTNVEKVTPKFKVKIKKLR
jgi:hypothetical protein